jgi:WD40 repeat protein
LDKTLRLWNGQNGERLALLKGHADEIIGALQLANGQLLSWSSDKTLRLWDSQKSICLATLEGHTDRIVGALELADRRLLSWSWDKTLRLWDSHSGKCIAILEGHTGPVFDAFVLTDGRFLSLSADKTLRLWDNRHGACLEVVPSGQINGEKHPEWVRALDRRKRRKIVQNFFLEPPPRAAQLCYKTIPIPVAIWHADSDTATPCLMLDGTAVVTLDSGQVCILKLYHGHRRISLAEAEEIIDSQIKKAG